MLNKEEIQMIETSAIDTCFEDLVLLLTSNTINLETAKEVFDTRFNAYKNCVDHFFASTPESQNEMMHKYTAVHSMKTATSVLALYMRENHPEEAEELIKFIDGLMDK